MRFVHLAASIAILSGSFVASANAADTANLGSCTSIQDRVQTALSNNAQSPSYHDAVKQQRYGLEYCAAGQYKNGVAHYAEALRLLGAQSG